MERLKFIDSFRGVAVLLVVLFHLNQLSFGFSGVEIFFVISGYIITLILLNEYEKNGEINVQQFYIRRVSRIYPILIVVILSILIVSINFPIISIQEKLSNELFYGAVQAANWYDYFHTSGYWEQGVQSPALHLWSLGIEMQFYLVWPLFISFLLKQKKDTGVMFSWLLVVYAILLSVIFYVTKDGIKGIFYYNTFIRSGSFIVGGYFAYLSKYKTIKEDWKCRMCTGISFLSFIVLTMSFSQKSVDLYRIIIPLYSLSIGYLLYAVYQNKVSRLVRGLIENKLFLFLGEISFSLYMVHVPIIIYFNRSSISHNLLFQRYSWLLNVVVIVLSIGIAFVLNRLIEKKIKVKTGKAALALILFLPLAVYWIQQQSQLFKFIDNQMVIEEKWINPEAIVSGEGETPILIVGDSWSRRTGFGMSMVQKEKKELSNYQVLTYGMGNTSIMNPEYFLDSDKKPVYQAKSFNGYEQMWLEAIQKYHPKYVVLQFGNADQSLQKIEGKELRVGDPQFNQRFILQYQNIIEFFQKQQIKIIVLNVVHNDQGKYNRMDNKLSDAINQNIKESVSKFYDIYFVDLQKLLEEDGKEITRQLVKNSPLFDETNHPSYTGSIYIGEYVFDTVCKIERGEGI